MNAIGLILAALKTWPEPSTLELDGVELLEVAELHSRLGEIGQVVSELKKLAAKDLAGRLDGQALRYGESIIRTNQRGSAKVSDPAGFWNLVAEVNSERTVLDAGAVLNALCPPNVRLTAIPKLLEGSGYSVEAIRDTFIAYDPPSSPLSVMPRSKAPKFLQDMEEGEIR